MVPIHMRTKTSVIDDISKIFAADKNEVREVFDKLASMSKDHRDLFICLAALSDDDRSMLMDYWKTLWGQEYSRDLVKDYVNRGDKKKVEASNAKMTKSAALSGGDRGLVRNYWDNLWGSEFAGDLVKDYKTDGETETVEASKYDQLMKTYAKILGQDTINKLRNMDAKTAAKALEELKSKKKQNL
jgi:hypothetical protein